MPYKIKHQRGQIRPWKVINTDTGKIVGSSKTKGDARASMRVRRGVESGKES